MSRHPVSIQQRLRRLSLVTSGIALLAASVSFVIYDARTFRSHFVQRVTAEADIVGANSISALVFSDESAATDTLHALAAEPSIETAAVYDRDGHLFARYARTGAARREIPERLVLTVTAPRRAPWDGLLIVHPVVFEGATVGTVRLDCDIWPELRGRLFQYGLIALLVFAGSLLVASVASTRLRRLLTHPILALVDTARIVSQGKDYSVRVQATADGELGLLVETFNEMLSAIEQRDAALREARLQLEQKVLERTLELQRELYDRQRAEEARAHSQALLARAEALAQIGSWEWDLRGVEMRWSDQLHHLLGLPSSAVATYESLLERIHPDDRDRVRARIDAVRQTGEPAAFEHRVTWPDGTVRTLDAQIERLPEAPGRPLRLVGTGQDVTERIEADKEREKLIRAQAARQAAEASERRAAVLGELSAELVASLDLDTVLPRVVRHVVPELADWCSIHRLEGGSIRRVALASADAELERLAWEMDERHPYQPDAAGGIPEVLRDGRTVHVEQMTDAMLGHMAEGEQLEMLRRIGFCSAIFVPLRPRGMTLGVVSFGMTTSARRFARADVPFAESIGNRIAAALDNARLYREAQDANRMKDEFLATLSHELRTPLNAIVGWTQLLRVGALDSAEVRRAIETIDRNARVQTQLIEDILDVSRIISGKLQLECGPAELAPVVQAAIDSVRPAAEAKQIEIVPQIAAGIVVLGDVGRLQQILWNLLSNATKFTPRGGRVDVQAARVGGLAEISVSDNGEGIAPEFLPHVFERFRQGDASSTRAHRGLGLGLAIVRHLTELHGGTAAASSPGPGRGSTFVVRLPLAPMDGVSEAPRIGADTQESLSGLRVMVVDDEPDTREVIEASLRLQGAHVVTLASAGDVMRCLPGERPDVLMADIEMPGMDGYALLRWLRSLPPSDGGDIPAIALTGYARPEDRRAALDAGFHAHLTKPVRPEEMARTVRRLARARSLQG
jgi:PAS domain S-box-containing protein